MRIALSGLRCRGWVRLAVLWCSAAAAAPLPAAAHETKTEWGSRAGLAEPNSEMAVAELDGRIYIVGGYPSDRVSVSTVQVYDIAKDSWSLTTPYPMPINHASAVGVDGLLYVIGGQTNAGTQTEPSRYVAAVHSYDPRTAKWTRRADMPVPVHGVTGLVYANGLIYLPGGGLKMGGSSGGLQHQTVRVSMTCG